MQFRIKPVLQQMADLYRMPRDRKRFEKYLQMLQGDTKSDLVLPIAGYNPMGSDHVLTKIEALIDLQIENCIEKELEIINSSMTKTSQNQIFDVVINLSDDIGGAWTDRYASHYTNTFDFGAIARRNFCTPYFWTSELTFAMEQCRERILEAIHRTIFFVRNGSPSTLEEHVEQEIFVHQNLNKAISSTESHREIEKFYETHKSSDDYSIIFNFFYGDEASESLGYRTYGRKPYEGFEWIRNQSFL